METSGLAEKADVVEECASSSAVTPNFFTPMQSYSSCSDHSDAGVASSVYYSTRIEGLSELRSKFDNQLEFDVEASKSHWTELSAESSDDSDVQVSNPCAATADSDASDEQVPNRVVFEMMKEHPLWGPLFRRQILEVEVGAKIAEGGQAEIFEALGRHPGRFDFISSEDGRMSLVLKVFKKGYSLVDLQRSWPPALVSAAFPNEYLVDSAQHLCWAVAVHLLDDERFAFVFERHWCDLRKFIDEIMLGRNGFPPFNRGIMYLYITAIATGIVGTGFWRAPEILLALKNRNLKRETFTQKSDVYSFAMTCYEVITGHMPFEDHDKWDYDIVLRGERPTLPDDLPYSMVNDLVTRCWHQDPLKRPSFVQILEDLHAIKKTYSLGDPWLSRTEFA